MAVLHVTDTETSGMTETDQVLEYGVVSFDPTNPPKLPGPSHYKVRRMHGGGYETNLMGRGTSTLIRPTVPVCAEARAAHHITDAELLHAPMAEEVFDKLPDMGVDDVFVAHNAEFDLRLLRQSGIPESKLPTRTICTWKCAQHALDSAPSHKNMVLRYALDLDGLFGILTLPGIPPHRVLADAVVTAALTRWLLREHSVEELETLTRTPVLQKFCRFGKNRGVAWSDVDIGFLRWVIGKDFDEDVKYAVRYWLSMHSTGAPPAPVQQEMSV